VESELPTTPGHRYQLNYSVRGPCAAGWWNGDIDPLSRRARDLLGGNDGAFINGATNSALRYVGPDSLFLAGMITSGAPGFPDIATKIELGDPPNLRFTNSFTIEGWVRPIAQTNSHILDLLALGDEEAIIEQIFFRGDSRNCRDPYYLALEQSAPDTFGLLFHIEGERDTDCGLTIEAEDVVNVAQWQHIAAVFESGILLNNNPPARNQVRLYLNGQRMTNIISHPIESPVDGFTGRSPFRDLDPAFSPGVTIGNRSRGGASEPFRGNIDELSVYARALTEPEIAAIAAVGRAGKFDRVVPPALSLAKVSVQLDGDQKDVGYGDNSAWTQRGFTFTALRTNVVLRLQSLLPGSQVDTVTLTEVPSALNFQPEEPLSQLNGQDAFGEWRLEIWDNRVGATNNNPQLDDWQLTFQLPPENPPPVVSLTHCVPYVNTLPPNGIQYFIVDVPQWATMATNILAFAEERFTTNPLPVTVLFNQTNFPVLTNLALIGPTSSGSSLMTASTNSVPPLLVGQTYFLAVTNPNPIAVTFSLGVCFDVVTLANCEPATNFVVGTAGIPRYFQFDMPTNGAPPGFPPLEATFWLTGASSNLTVVLSQQLPLPDLGHYDYISVRPCTNDEILLVVTNSTPFPIQTNRWYVGIFNSTATNVPFTVTACYSTNYPTIIPLTNAVPYTAALGSTYAAPPGPPRWFFFEFSVTNQVNGLLFELYNLSGDADLVLQRDVPPGQAPYFDGSFQLDTDPEQIVVRAGPDLPDLRGNWLLGVYNNETTNVAYTIRATMPSTNGLLVSALPIIITLSPLPATNGNLIQWDSVVGETYFIRFSRSLFPPDWMIIGTVLATTPCSTFVVPSASGFAQVIQGNPNNVIAQPVLTIQLLPPNQVRISWSTAFPGYTLQSAPSPLGPWMNAGLAVLNLGSEYVAIDTIGASPKFYRLFK
jgi:concanavalin A-like lectin/glucanase superfamily protein